MPTVSPQSPSTGKYTRSIMRATLSTAAPACKTHGWLFGRRLSFLPRFQKWIIQKKAPKDTGEYKDSWVIQKVQKKKVIVGTPKNNLWKWLEFGTATHFVAPKRKQALMWGNGKYFSKGHNVSGITAVPHTRPAMKKLPPKLLKIVKKKVKRHFKPFK